MAVISGHQHPFTSLPICACTATPCPESSLSAKIKGNVVNTTSPSVTTSSSRARASRAQSLFGGLFGRKSQQEAPQPKLLLHEDIEIPFPASLLADTFLAGKELKCCYKATRDGFEAACFHQRCDFTGPCVVVAISSTGLRFGAFSPEGYRSTDDYYDTFDAFLFYWQSGDDAPVVLKKVGGSGAALFDYARGGPQFGADGLLIGPPKAPVMGGFAGPDTNSGGGDLREAKSRLGLSYAVRPDGKDSVFGDSRVATLEEVEVFCCPAIAALY